MAKRFEPTKISLAIFQQDALKWTEQDPILQKYELGFESDTKKLKIGDDVTPWTLLAYAGGGGTEIGGTVTGGTAGSVLFLGAGGVLAQDNARLFWDATTGQERLSITAGADPTDTAKGGMDFSFNGNRGLRINSANNGIFNPQYQLLLYNAGYNTAMKFVESSWNGGGTGPLLTISATSPANPNGGLDNSSIWFQGTSFTSHKFFIAAANQPNIENLPILTSQIGMKTKLSAGHTADSFVINDSTDALLFKIDNKGKASFDAVMTAGGTTGAQTINKPSGSVNFAASASSLVVTNSIVAANSIVIAIVMTNDATLKSVQAVPAAGSFTLFGNAAATAETKVGFLVINS